MIDSMNDSANELRSDRPLIPVIISGGSGTRLWPLSRETRPKQFLPLVGSTSLYQLTLSRVRGLGLGVRPPIVVCNEAHGDFALAQSRGLGIELGAVVLESVGRNTAPAVALAALLATRAVGAGEDPLLLVLPADHVIADERAFAAAVRVAVEAAERGRLVTFGVVPDRPETGYGYILRGRRHGDWADIGKFVEKPDLATAEAYVASGEYLWNSGMFLFSAARWLEELQVHAPEILAVCERAVAAARSEGAVVRFGAELAHCPADSIDYAVMERTTYGAVVPLAAGWSDVGSWSALHDVLQRDAQGNSTSGDVLIESCRNVQVRAKTRLVAAVGLEDVVVVETEDAVLVLRRDHAQDVKKIVDALRARQRRET
jgi:mannose-1-phosphate guanylyltransferase/mannose-6-phosphate isomerase